MIFSSRATLASLLSRGMCNEVKCGFVCQQARGNKKPAPEVRAVAANCQRLLWLQHFGRRRIGGGWHVGWRVGAKHRRALELAGQNLVQLAEGPTSGQHDHNEKRDI